MDKLAVIGCGIAALPVLKKARELGVETFCFSLGINPDVSDLYDHHIKVDYLNPKAIIDYCIEIGVDGVIATGENTTETTAIVADALGLPGNECNGGFIANNKHLERMALIGAKFVQQPSYSVYNGDIPKFPVVVKAIDTSGKKGITIARNLEEFHFAIAYAKEASTNGTILIEQYLDGGIEYSIECISSKGKHQVIQVTQKEVSGLPHFSELGHHEPGALEISYDELEAAVFEILDRTGIRNSLSHVEVKIIDGKIYFIELGARGGGDKISDTLVYLSTDFDLYASAIQVALGKYKYKPAHNTYYSGLYFLCQQTKYLLPLFEYAKGQDWCKELNMPGDELIEINGNDDGSKSGYFVYQTDHKITLKDVPFKYDIINDYPNALSLLCDFTKESKREITKKAMVDGMQKFIDKGNVVACLYKGKIYGMLNVYCNHVETGDAYLNNVEILECYRGLGLSKGLLKLAYQVVLDKGFRSLSLEVSDNNKVAIQLYLKEGFSFTSQSRLTENGKLLEMQKILH